MTQLSSCPPNPDAREISVSTDCRSSVAASSPSSFRQLDHVNINRDMVFGEQ